MKTILSSLLTFIGLWGNLKTRIIAYISSIYLLSGAVVFYSHACLSKLVLRAKVERKLQREGSTSIWCDVVVMLLF